MLKEIKKALFLFVIMAGITGVAYPLVVTVIAKTLFSANANGSLVEKDGKQIGSKLIGQQFSKAEYFHPRPSNAGSGYDAMASGASNVGVTNTKLQESIAQRYKNLNAENKNNGKNIPEDLLTSSASGLDPHISPEAAMFQVPSVAKARKIKEADVTSLVEKNIEGRFLGIFGQPRVNVLKLNIELESLVASR